MNANSPTLDSQKKTKTKTKNKNKIKNKNKRQYRIFLCMKTSRICFFYFSVAYFLALSFGCIIYQFVNSIAWNFFKKQAYLLLINIIPLVFNFLFLLSVLIMAMKDKDNFANDSLINFIFLQMIISIISPIAFIIIHLVKIKFESKLIIGEWRSYLVIYIFFFLFVLGVYISIKLYNITKIFHKKAVQRLQLKGIKR